MVPYAFSMCIWVAPISAYFFHWDIPYLFKKYILCVDPSQLWFLWMLFGVFVIVWPIRKVILDNSLLGYGISIVLYCLGLVGRKMTPNIFCIWTSCQYFLFFYLGMMIRSNEENIERRKALVQSISWYIWVAADICIYLSLQICYQRAGMIWKAVEILGELCLHFVGALMAYTSMQSLANYVPWQKNRFFRKIAACSMPMYLFHQQIIYFTITLFNGRINPWLNTCANFIVAFFGSLLISMVLMKWRITRILIGAE